MVIATVFLGIIGLSAGLVLGSRHREDAQPAPSQTGQTTPSRSASCRAETQDAAQLVGAAGPLTRVLLLRTRTSVIYICRDRAGSLYYHANTGGDVWIENQTALFLPNVTRGDGDYRVTAGNGTTFSVNRKRLLIVHPDGREEEQPAVG